jgi:DNA-binding MarR family transcriptional regulator
MKEFLIRPSQLAVLLLVRHNPGLTQAAVSRVLDITKTNLVPLLDGLEKRGLLERRKAKGDRRAFALHLTRKGETYAAKMEVRHNKMEVLLRKRLGEKTSDELLRLLHMFSQSVES